VDTEVERKIDEFLGLDLSETTLPIPEETVSLVKKPGEVFLATIGSVLHWVLTAQVLPYVNNRGTGKVSPSTFKRIYEDGVKPDVVGEVTLGVYENAAGEKEFCFNNWHSRTKAFLARWRDKKLTAKELATIVSVRVQKDFIDSYQKMNAPGSAHQTKDKICNPDLAYGVYLKGPDGVFERLGANCETLIGSNKWTIISALLYNLGENEVTDWFWPQVYRLRSKARLVADKKQGEFKITKKKLDTFVEAVDFWYKLMLMVKAENSSKVKIDKIIRSAGFFGYIVADQLGAKKFHSSAKITSNRIYANYHRLLLSLPELTRGTDETVTKFAGDLDKIFKKAQESSVSRLRA
jgi:hypothetical protein